MWVCKHADMLAVYYSKTSSCKVNKQRKSTLLVEKWAKRTILQRLCATFKCFKQSISAAPVRKPWSEWIILSMERWLTSRNAKIQEWMFPTEELRLCRSVRPVTPHLLWSICISDALLGESVSRPLVGLPGLHSPFGSSEDEPPSTEEQHFPEPLKFRFSSSCRENGSCLDKLSFPYL